MALAIAYPTGKLRRAEAAARGNGVIPNSEVIAAIAGPAAAACASKEVGRNRPREFRRTLRYHRHRRRPNNRRPRRRPGQFDRGLREARLGLPPPPPPATMRGDGAPETKTKLPPPPPPPKGILG